MPDAVVLDVNLGGETAHPVADLFVARGVPFLFTTAYNKSSRPARFAAAPGKAGETRAILGGIEHLLAAA